jgi:hypothetical protein
MVDVSVCVLVSDKKRPVVKGSVQRLCLFCKFPIWVSPATQKAIKAKIYPDKLVCTECVSNDVRAIDVD